MLLWREVSLHTLQNKQTSFASQKLKVKCSASTGCNRERSGDVLLLCVCNRFPSAWFIVWTLSSTERVNGVFRPQAANAFKAQSSTHMVCILALLEWCVHGIWFPGNSFHWLNQSLFFLRKLPLWHPTTTTNHHLNRVFKMQLVWKIAHVHVRRLRGYLA